MFAHIKKLNPSVFFIAIIAILLAILIASFILNFFLGKSEKIDSAISDGRRIEMMLSTGEIYGEVKLYDEYSNKSKKKPFDTEKSDNEEVDTTSSTKKVNEQDVVDPGENPSAEIPDEELGNVVKEEGSEVKIPNKNKSDSKKKGIGDGIEVVKEVSNKEEEGDKKNSETLIAKNDFIGPPMPEDMLKLLNSDEKKRVLKFEYVSLKELKENPVVVIVVKSLGLSSSSTNNAMDLPNNVTFGFSPYSPNIKKWSEETNKSGHEIILNIPMETENYNFNNPGPFALLTGLSNAENVARLKNLLSLVDGYSAVYSDNGEIFTQSSSYAKPILQMLKEEGKYFLYGNGYANHSIIQLSERLVYPLLASDILLDENISKKNIAAKMHEAEQVARERGYVVIMARPYPLTVRMLQEWIPFIEKKGLNVRPASSLLGKIFVE